MAVAVVRRVTGVLWTCLVCMTNVVGWDLLDFRRPCLDSLRVRTRSIWAPTSGLGAWESRQGRAEDGTGGRLSGICRVQNGGVMAHRANRWGQANYSLAIAPADSLGNMAVDTSGFRKLVTRLLVLLVAGLELEAQLLLLDTVAVFGRLMVRHSWATIGQSPSDPRGTCYGAFCGAILSAERIMDGSGNRGRRCNMDLNHQACR